MWPFASQTSNYPVIQHGETPGSFFFFIESSRSFFHGLEGGLSSASHLSAIGSEAKWGVNVGLSMIGALQIQLLSRYLSYSIPITCWGYRIRQTFGKRSVGPGCLHTCEPLDSRDGLSSWRWSANCEKLEYLRGDERKRRWIIASGSKNSCYKRCYTGKFTMVYLVFRHYLI
jgi:hypothetical protein